MGQLWARLCCKKDDSELGLEFLRAWDVDIREDGEWMEPTKKKSQRNSGRDKVKESVSPKRPSEEWAGWLHVIDNLDKLDIDDLDTFPCPDEEIEAAVNKADFRVDLGSPPWANADHEGFMTASVGSLYSDDSVLMALKESNKAKGFGETER